MVANAAYASSGPRKVLEQLVEYVKTTPMR